MTGGAAVTRIRDGGIIALLRPLSATDLLAAAEALRDGGIAAIEITLPSPGALEVLERVRTALGRDAVVGMGAVLTKDQARDAIRAGAEFLAAPTLNPEVLRAGIDAGVPVIPGALTPTEIVRAWELGASLVKVFPVSTVGPRYIADLRGPLPHIPLVPAGGVSLGDVAAFVQAGAAAVEVGSDLVSPEALGRQALRDIARRAQEIVEAVQKARERGAPPPAPAIMPTEGPDTR